MHIDLLTIPVLIPRLLFLAIALSLCATPAIQALPTDERTGVNEEAARQVVTILRHSREVDPDEHGRLVEDLSAHLPAALTETLEIIRSRTLPEIEAGQGAQTLSRPQQSILWTCFDAIDRGDVLAARELFCAVDNSLARCRVGLRILGIAGGAPDVAKLLEEAVSVEGGEGRLPRELNEPLTCALADLLTKDHRSFAALQARLTHLSSSLLVPCVRAIGRSADARGHQLLVDLLHLNPEHAPLILGQVRLLRPSLDNDLNQRMVARIRRDLDPADAELCRSACLALAFMQDRSAAIDLIELLGCGNQGVISNAHTALRQLCELEFPCEQRIWKNWWQAEGDWLITRSQLCRRQLLSPDPALVLRGLRELQGHRLHAQAFAPDFAAPLSHARLEVRAQACSTIAQLDLGSLIPELLPLLEDRSQVVVNCAQDALQSLTGLEGGPSVAAWRAKLHLR